MYNASSAFSQAIADGEHQIALLIFDDAVFTNDDIDVSRGITFNDYFNMSDDMAIGQALSNEISFSLFNDDGLLDDYEFGDFTATIGVQIESAGVTMPGTVNLVSGSRTWSAYSSRPYLKMNGTAVATQPARKVKNMLAYDGILYCYLENDTVVAYYDTSNPTVKSVTLIPYMKDRLKKWENKGICYNKATRMLNIWEGSNQRTYEFVPLGRFTAERPNVPAVNAIDMTCYDFMQKFEQDMPRPNEMNMTYPTTFRNLFIKMCNYANVNYRNTTFINSTAEIVSEPEDFKSVTMREVLQWLAEAAGSNAKFDRDGYLVMDWLHDTTVSLDETGYKEFNPYWYETKTVTKLRNRSSDGSFENVTGSGSETYLIQDNPLLKGVS